MTWKLSETIIIRKQISVYALRESESRPLLPKYNIEFN